MTTLAKAITNYDLHCHFEKNLSVLTRKAYKIDLQQFLKSAGINRWASRIDKEDIRKFLSHLFESQYHETSIRRKLASLKAFFKYLEFEKIIKVNPIWGLEIKIRIPRRIPKNISLSDIQSLMLQTRAAHGSKRKTTDLYDPDFTKISNDLTRAQQIAIMELLFSTGMRVGELCSLDISDLDLSAKTVKVFGKGSRERILQITHPDVIDAFHHFIALRKLLTSDSNALFLDRLKNRLQPHSVRLMLRAFAIMAKLKTKVTPHMIRHTTATLMLENGIDIRFVQKVLGHISISTTEWYTHISSAAERKVLEEKHPRNLLSASPQ